MGHPENMNLDQVQFLKEKDKADKKIKYINIDNTFSTCISIPDHGIALLMLEKY